jgi:hypothetical protein
MADLVIKIMYCYSIFRRLQLVGDRITYCVVICVLDCLF